MRNNGHFPISLFNIIKVIRLYKEGKKDVLIAIDIVAEKDLDIDFFPNNIQHVINDSIS